MNHLLSWHWPLVDMMMFGFNWSVVCPPRGVVAGRGETEWSEPEWLRVVSPSPVSGSGAAGPYHHLLLTARPASKLDACYWSQSWAVVHHGSVIIYKHYADANNCNPQNFCSILFMTFFIAPQSVTWISKYVSNWMVGSVITLFVVVCRLSRADTSLYYLWQRNKEM